MLLTGSIVVVAGTTVRLTVVLPIATTTPRPFVASILASAWCCPDSLHGNDGFLLLNRFSSCYF